MGQPGVGQGRSCQARLLAKLTPCLSHLPESQISAASGTDLGLCCICFPKRGLLSQNQPQTPFKPSGSCAPPLPPCPTEDPKPAKGCWSLGATPSSCTCRDPEGCCSASCVQSSSLNPLANLKYGSTLWKWHWIILEAKLWLLLPSTLILFVNLCYVE